MKTKLILLLSVFILPSVVFSLETKGVKTDPKEKINQTEVKKVPLNKAPLNKTPLKKVNQNNNPKKRKKNPELRAEMEKINQEFEREKLLITDKYKKRIGELRKLRKEEIDRLKKEFEKRRNEVKNKYKR